MSVEIVYNTVAEQDLDVNDRNFEIRNMLKHGVCDVTFTDRKSTRLNSSHT